MKIESMACQLRLHISAAWYEQFLRACLASIAIFALAATAQAQLRIVSYNTATADPENNVLTPRAGMETVLRSIGEETRNGVSRPIDVLLLQEQYKLATTTEAFVDLLNDIYGADTYARGTLEGFTSDPNQRGGRPGIVYNTNTVQLIQEVRFGFVNGSNQARSTMRYRLQPVGYDESATFYAYNDHYKAGSTSSDRARRGVEADSIRNHSGVGSDVLGEGAHVIYAGDHNSYTSSEPAIQTLLAAGPGQAFDPLNRLGSWSGNSSFADVHTQSPCNTSCGTLTAGGMDDRFDFQFVTGEMLDGEGLGIIPGSYHTFGNNGTTYNTNINSGSNTYVFDGVTSYTKPQILGALRTASDHIPVVADYQLPAVMEAVADAVPATLNFGQAFNLGVTVSNGADVLAALGADELDYSVTSGGAVSGSFLNQVDAALDGGNLHQFSLDTTTLGMKTGSIAIASTSQMVQNGTVNIPISYLVVLPGDYDENGEVNAADYIQWRSTLGQNVANGTGADGNGNGIVDDADYSIWIENFGQSAPFAAGAMAGQGSAAANLPGSTVPEPSTCGLVIVGVCLASLAGGTLRGWTPRT